MTDENEDAWPIPQDDGASDHLEGAIMPRIKLRSGRGIVVDVGALEGLTVLFLFPMSGADNSGLPPEWDSIPGARGCSPQACGFRDRHVDLLNEEAAVLGIATHSPDYLAGEIDRLALPYDLLSDEHFEFQRALNLPLMSVNAGGRPVYRRITLVCQDARIIKVFYPVFPPSTNASEVLSWIKMQRAGARRRW